MNTKKILVFLQSGVGGSERVSITISKYLIEKKYNVKYVIVGNSNEILNLLPRDSEVYRIKIYHQRLLGIRRIYKILRKELPDFVFSSIIFINLRVLLAAKLLGIKAIVRNDNNLTNRKYEEIPLMKYLYPSALWIIAQQEEMKIELVKKLSISPDLVKVLHNPIALDVIERKSQESNPYPLDGSINYLWCGRFAPEKGQDLLLESFKIVMEKQPTSHLYLVGAMNEATSYFDKILSIISGYNFNGHVHLIGYDNNPYKWMKYCSCYVMPSRLEGLPNSLIEAMYLQRPVVATACIPVVNRIIEHGVNGYVVENENIYALADAMIKALHLKNVRMSYIPSSKEDFINLFN